MCYPSSVPTWRNWYHRLRQQTDDRARSLLGPASSICCLGWPQARPLGYRSPEEALLRVSPRLPPKVATNPRALRMTVPSTPLRRFVFALVLMAIGLGLLAGRSSAAVTYVDRSCVVRANVGGISPYTMSIPPP